MSPDTHTDAMGKVKWDRWKFFVSSLLFAGGCVFLGITSLVISNRQTTILETCSGEKHVFINGAMPAEYLRVQVAEVIMDELHYAFPSIRDQFARLVAKYDASIINQKRQIYYQRADAIKTGEIISSFHIESQSVKTPTSVTVRGTRTMRGKDGQEKLTTEAWVVEFASTSPFRLIDIRREE